MTRSDSQGRKASTGYFNTRALVAGVALAWVSAGCAAAMEQSATRELFILSGQIVDAVDGRLVLRHDGGRVEVNFRRWPERGPGGIKVMGVGDTVIVTGWLDKRFIKSGSLDILSVYVEDRRAIFTLGEAEHPAILPLDTLGRDGDASMTGTIVELEARGFVLQAGPVAVEVDTAPLFYNPYDDVGVQRLEVGDRVRVTGMIVTELLEQLVIRADGVTDIHIVEVAN